MASSPIDWDAAVRVGAKAAPTGPSISAIDAAVAVSDLRRLSRTAELAVRDVTGMGVGLDVLDGMVVDRAGWVRATAEGMAVLTEPLNAKIAGQVDSRRGKGAHRAMPRTGAVAAAPIGSVLGYLSGKVLGQFDPFVSDPGHPDVPGRLLLVAPNIVKVERLLGVPPQDFRLWVCLHESTHRLQFTAVPWLREHFRSLVAGYIDATDLDPSAFVDRIVSAIRGRSGTDGKGRSWIEATQNAEQRVVFEQLLALMTVLEGHADFVMDAVGPQVVPSVARIRSGFEERRRRGSGPLDRVLRSLLGMDLKMQQYVQGGGFVRAVVDRVGMDGFNRIWSSPESLPTRAEIREPSSWIDRLAR